MSANDLAARISAFAYTCLKAASAPARAEDRDALVEYAALSAMWRDFSESLYSMVPVILSLRQAGEADSAIVDNVKSTMQSASRASGARNSTTPVLGLLNQQNLQYLEDVRRTRRTGTQASGTPGRGGEARGRSGTHADQYRYGGAAGGFASPHVRESRDAPCSRFNNDVRCSSMPCKWRHVCRACGSSAHGALNCDAVTPRGGDRGASRDGGRGGARAGGRGGGGGGGQSHGKMTFGGAKAAATSDGTSPA